MIVEQLALENSFLQIQTVSLTIDALIFTDTLRYIVNSVQRVVGRTSQGIVQVDDDMLIWMDFPGVALWT